MIATPWYQKISCVEGLPRCIDKKKLSRYEDLASTVEALLSHTPPSHEKCMGYEGLWEDRERLHARLAGIPVPNVMKGINGQSKGIKKSLGMS